MLETHNVVSLRIIRNGILFNDQHIIENILLLCYWLQCFKIHYILLG